MDGTTPEQPRHYRLKIYNADRIAHSARLGQALQEAMRVAVGPDSEVEMEVIDILEAPQAAQEAQVYATPMVVKDLPEPIKRVIGDLTDARRILMLLELVAEEPGPRDGGH